MSAAVYISYFGLREPLVQTQVLPYVREIAASGVTFTLLTFEPARPWSGDSLAEAEAALRRDGIEWVRRRYHRRLSLPATLWDVIVGAWTTAAVVRRRRAKIIHARSHVAAMMGALAKIVVSAKVLFDIRGLLAEEYVAGGNWKAGGLLFRMTKAAERWLMRRSDGFVVLTERARDFFFPGGDAKGRPIEVIPTCTDTRLFAAAAPHRDAVRSELGAADAFVLAYVGSLGTWYRTDDLAEFLAVAWRSDPRTFVLCLTSSDPRLLLMRLETRGVPPQRIVVRAVAPGEIPRQLSAADAGVSFSEAGVARLGASPTKIGEYLASGIPVVQSAGIGDLDALIESRRVGVLLREYGESAYRQAIGRLDELRRDPDLASRCRNVAREVYDLPTVGGMRYRRIYHALLDRS